MADTTPTLREAAQQALEALEQATRPQRWPFAVKQDTGAAITALRAALAEQAAEQAEPVAPHLSYPHITQPYTLEEIRAQIASHDYSAELLLQHAMLLLDDAEQAEPVAVPAGWALVPVEPTAEMCAAPKAETWVGSNYCERIYRAMIAAAPPAPARQEPLTEEQAKAAFEQWAAGQEWLEDDEGRINLRYLGLHRQYVDMSIEHASRAFKAGLRTAAPAEGGAA